MFFQFRVIFGLPWDGRWVAVGLPLDLLRCRWIYGVAVGLPLDLSGCRWVAVGSIGSPLGFKALGGDACRGVGLRRLRRRWVLRHWVETFAAAVALDTCRDVGLRFVVLKSAMRYALSFCLLSTSSGVQR